MKSISFSPDMMRALLEGRKSQTRRIHANGKPKFEIGEIVWVKEALVRDPLGGTDYLTWLPIEHPNFGQFATNLFWEWNWKKSVLPAMYCPKWASRVTLKITNVRKVDIFAITDSDAHAEGFGDSLDFLKYFLALNKMHDDMAVYSKPLIGFAYDFEVVS